MPLFGKPPATDPGKPWPVMDIRVVRCNRHPEPTCFPEHASPGSCETLSLVWASQERLPTTLCPADSSFSTDGLEDGRAWISPCPLNVTSQNKLLMNSFVPSENGLPARSAGLALEVIPGQ